MDELSIKIDALEGSMREIKAMLDVITENMCVPRLTQNAPVYDEHGISELLQNIGIPAHLKGYQYIKEAILHLGMEPYAMRNVVSETYYPIAKKYGVTAQSVERNMRTAIAAAWDRGGSQALYECTHISVCDKPPVKEFLAVLGEYFWNDRLNETTNTRTM